MASEKKQVFRCELCGSIVEVLNGGAGVLVCCNQPMQLLEGNTTDAATEKHVPVIDKIDGGYNVQVGSVLHPMESNHYIQWIELLVGGKVYREELSPGQTPEAVFMVDEEGPVLAREYCNIHGLWKAEQ